MLLQNKIYGSQGLLVIEILKNKRKHKHKTKISAKLQGV